MQRKIKNPFKLDKTLKVSLSLPIKWLKINSKKQIILTKY